MANEWIDWTGGECPVDGETRVEVRLRDGFTSAGVAMGLRWDHKGYIGDIIAYRLHQPEPEYGEWIKCSERMPEKDMEVIIFGYQGVGVGWSTGKAIISYDECGDSRITHWMPAPAAPEEPKE